MINQVVVRKLFVDRLAEVFGPPKNPDVVVKELMKVMPSEATDDGLERLANEVVQSRRAKSFPSLNELIQIVARLAKPRVLPRSGKQYDLLEHEKAAKRERDEDDFVRGLRGTALAKEAIAGGWAVGLCSFVREHLRAPDAREIESVRRLVAQNDTVYTNPGYFGAPLIELRHDMHDHAKRELS